MASKHCHMRTKLMNHERIRIFLLCPIRFDSGTWFRLLWSDQLTLAVAHSCCLLDWNIPCDKCWRYVFADKFSCVWCSLSSYCLILDPYRLRRRVCGMSTTARRAVTGISNTNRSTIRSSVCVFSVERASEWVCAFAFGIFQIVWKENQCCVFHKIHANIHDSINEIAIRTNGSVWFVCASDNGCGSSISSSSIWNYGDWRHTLNRTQQCFTVWRNQRENADWCIYA